MKTISTLFISIIALVATATANNLEITNTSFVAATSLSSSNAAGSVVLNWVAKNESSNVRYEVERSFYSNSFSSIATLSIVFNNGAAVKNYRINDNDAALAGRTTAYYRIKQTSANGTVTYSNTMMVTLNNAAAGTASTVAAVRFTSTQNGNAVINLKNATGKTAASINTLAVAGANTVALEANVAAKGMYVAEVIVNGVVTATQRVIID